LISGTAPRTMDSARPTASTAVEGATTRSAARRTATARRVTRSGSPGPTPTPVRRPADRVLVMGPASLGGGRRHEGRGQFGLGGEVHVQVAGQQRRGREAAAGGSRSPAQVECIAGRVDAGVVELVAAQPG